MKYVAIHFTIECSEELLQPARDLLAYHLGEVGFESFEETARGLTGYIPESAYSASALAQSIEEFSLPGVSISYQAEALPDADWNEAWEREGFAPINIEGRVVIFDAKQTIPAIPEVCGDEPDAPSPIMIGIEARMAFGTGTHETTRMVVGVLSRENLVGKRVLDCGCGTGILGIAALKMGAAEAVGYDIDEWSVENSRHNALLNKVENLHVLHGDAGVLSHVSGVFDVVVANINRNILLADMHAFKDAMTAGSMLVLSGFYECDIPLLLDEAHREGLHEKQRIVGADDWACLVLTY